MVKRQRNLFGWTSAHAKAKGIKRRSPGLIQTAGQRRVAGMIRKRRGSSGKKGSVSAELVSALTNLGYKSGEARSMASRARGSDFDSKLRSALSRNPRWRKTVDEITDRAKRYRANAVKPKGPKRCAYRHRLNPCKGKLGVNHIDGNESHGEQSNLNWACKRHNAQLAIYHKAMGQGVRTRQYNPGATNLAQYVQAAVDHVRGAHDEGGKILHETPKSKRRSFAREIAFRKTGSYQNPVNIFTKLFPPSRFYVRQV
jgi:RuvA, C-terminal domain